MASTDTHTNTNNLALAAARHTGGGGGASAHDGGGGAGGGGGAPGGSGCHYQLHESSRQHEWRCQVSGVTDPAAQVRVFVHDGRLLIQVAGKQVENVPLPPTAFTGDAKATYQRGCVTVTCSAKDPSAPAMVEKALLNPDRPHPRQLPLALPTGGGGGGGGGATSAAAGAARMGVGSALGVPDRPDPTGHGQPAPAAAEYGARNAELFGRPGVAAVMPAAAIGSVTAADMPVLTNPGGALEAPDNGETVVLDVAASDTRLYVPPEVAQAQQAQQQQQRSQGQQHVAHGAASTPGQHMADTRAVDQLSSRLGRAELAPAGTTVVRGGRDKVVEKEYGSYGGGGSDAGGGGGTDQYTRKTVDITEEKVGMATRPLEARDFYATSERGGGGTEPYSSVKAQNEVEGVACDLCQCAPCQCDKMTKGYAYELTPAEQKRHGKPSMHTTHKAVTGTNAHAAHDYKLHSKPRSEQHALVGDRMREWTGNVPSGTGSLDDLTPEQRHKLGQVNVGGHEIDKDLLRDHTAAAATAPHFLG
ncbi:hypothetical protein HYH02_002618 [Chlamydomonas schloesseri]|uniref:Uncharacterized protein n=1 Tax=Chlamydomonas schloesseri TaxID=2026947 RepID=A0A835WRY5_9CHLO|nr:hypothetical protein HYH02_002618 [Chlamydomonas schloesseri]|eukprot:KAG2452372.1 hypothetical protein HYH02_002618 [Chlamydomonas schloesseri]